MADKDSSSSSPSPSPQGQKSLPSDSGETPSIVNPQPSPSAAASTVLASSSTGPSHQQPRGPANVHLPFVVGFIPDFTYNNIEFQEMANQDLSPSPSPSWNHHSSSSSNPPSSPKRWRPSQLSVYAAVKEQIIRSVRRRPPYTALMRKLDPNSFTGRFPLEPVRPFQKSLRFFYGHLRPSLLPELPPLAAANTSFDELVQELRILSARAQELNTVTESFIRQKQSPVMNPRRRAARNRKLGLKNLLPPPPNDEDLSSLEAFVKDVKTEILWLVLQMLNSIEDPSDPSTSNDNDNANESLSSDTVDKPKDQNQNKDDGA